MRMALTSASHHSFQRAHRVDQGVQVGVPWFHDFETSEQSDDSAVIENVVPGPGVTYTAPAPVIEYVPDDTYAAPPPVIEKRDLRTYIAPASPRINRDIRGLVNPQCLHLLWRPLPQKSLVRFPALDESARIRASPSGTDRCGTVSGKCQGGPSGTSS